MSALVSRFPEGMVFGAAISAGILVQEKIGENNHPSLLSILVIVTISVIGQLLLFIYRRKQISSS